MDTLELLREALVSRGVTFALARVKQETRDELAAAGFVTRVGQDHVFATLPTAVAAYARWHRDRFGEFPDGIPGGVVT